MSDHAIRLRAGWEARDLDAVDAAPSRLDLPVDWAAFGAKIGRLPRRVQLSRRFGRPLDGAPPYRAVLRLDAAEGVVSIAINGAAIAWTMDAPGRIRAELPELEPRNLLVVEVESPAPGATDWGEVSIVFTGRDEAAGRAP